MRDLISHPCILLYDHLQGVGTRAASILLQLKPHLRLAIPSDDLARAAFITGICHDFGKAKRQFQDYIWGRERKEQEHAVISSVFTFLVATEIFGNKPQPIRLLPFVCAYAVSRHHGFLCNLEEAFDKIVLNTQIAIAKGNIDERIWGFQFTHKQLGITVKFSEYRKRFEHISAEEIAKCIREFGKLLRQKSEEKDASESWLIDFYFALLLIVASLTESDVACVLDAPEPNVCQRIDPERVRSYAFCQSPASESLQRLRQKAWQEIQDLKYDDTESALRLTLPTGLGKTLMGLYISGQMQQRLEVPNPVIYALPYLSIIEQTTHVARSVFPQDGKGISIIQHHSLSFPETKGEETPNFERARFSLEDWNADLIVTTFDQLFYSFLSSDRGFIRRFFRLPGSVLLLDEVQTIPPRLIPAVEMLLQQLRHKLNTRIVYMTATFPPFLKHIHGVVSNEESYFKPLERTRLHLHLEPMPFSDYLCQVSDWLKERRGKKVLFVTNTIRSARMLFQHLCRLKKEKESTLGDMQLFYLSGSIVPVERLKRIRQIKEILEKQPDAWVIVVSTQCVEAGVDLDMDEAVRDFGPWDSLLQVGGRANRFGKKPCADVWVYCWIDDISEKRQKFHSYIYDPVFTDATLKVLKDRRTIDEKDYLNIQQAYVQELERRLSQQQSYELLRCALSWQFGELEFQKLFREQERAWKVSVFCVADDTSEKLKDIAIELWSNKQPKNALKLLESLCDNSELFQPLKDFLGIEPQVVKRFVESIKCAPERSLRFQVGKLLQPMLQAYTISLPIRRLEEVPFCYIMDGFPYLPRDVYEAINGNAEEGQKDEFPD